MRRSRALFFALSSFLILGWMAPALAAQNSSRQKQTIQTPSTRDARRVASLVDEVRHELVMLPYYSVFDWLEGEAAADGTVILRGQVIRPSTKSDAGSRLKDLESVSKVVNQIEVLPVSPSDDQLRIALYRAIYRYDSPLFRYGTQAVPPIHIIVKNGRATLKGVVDSQADSQLAFMAANNVSGLFEVKNELKVLSTKVSRK